MVTPLEQAVKANKKGQINIVLKKQLGMADAVSRQESKVFQSMEHETFQAIQAELDECIGLSTIKQYIKEVYASLYLNKKREEAGLKAAKQVLHMVFKGNPGTGKTTVARIIAKLFKDMGVLEKGHLIEVERADLVGEYIGHTAQKTRAIVQKAMGGILFIDEAYSLARGGEKDFGKEAIDTLVKVMEDESHSFVLILAGYPKEMDHFLSANPGLPSRFPTKVSFPNYSIHELLIMANKQVKERDYFFDKQAEASLPDILRCVKEKEKESFSNGRFIRNLIERAIRVQAIRLLEEENYAKKDLMTLKGMDLSRAFYDPDVNIE